MIAAFARVAIVALGLVASPVIAGPDEDRAALVRLQQEDARLQSIGWRLATANAPFCAPRPSIGLLLQDMANFTEPARMRAATGIAGDIVVQAVAAGSPAHKAGLTANDEILAIDGRAMANLPPAKAGDWQRLASLHGLVDAALDRDGEVRIAFRRAGDESREVTVGSNQTCPSRFELIDNSERAVADGKRVLIGRKFAGLDYSEDELAAALAHEFAHNLLGHRAWLSEAGRKRANIRLTEREADRLMPWLLANAGYPPEAAARFFERWGPGNGGWIFRARTHDGWDERADFVRAELSAIESLRANGSAADWRTHFRREIEP